MEIETEFELIWLNFNKQPNEIKEYIMQYTKYIHQV